MKILSINDDKMTTRGELIEYPAELIGGRNLLFKEMYEFGTGFSASPIGATYEELKSGVGATRIRTKELINIDGNYIIKLHNKDYRFLLFLFDETKGYLGLTQGEISWRTDDYIIPDRAKYVAVLIDKNNTTLTLNDFDDAKFKLEKGTKATDWTPAPEDLGLSYPDWVTEFKPSISENGILAPEFDESGVLSFSINRTTAQEFIENPNL